MRIAELSRRTGVPAPTIKYYVREGLLRAGERVGPNQASYDEDHVHRLRLIRALVDVGGLSVSAAHRVLNAVDEPDVSLHKVLGAVSKSLGPAADPLDDPAQAAARERVKHLVDDHGWQVGHDHPAINTLAGLVVTLDRLGHQEFTKVFDTYAAACETIARADLDWLLNTSVGQDERLEAVVVGTVLGETALDALRRLAHAHISAISTQ